MDGFFIIDILTNIKSMWLREAKIIQNIVTTATGSRFGGETSL